LKLHLESPLRWQQNLFVGGFHFRFHGQSPVQVVNEAYLPFLSRRAHACAEVTVDVEVICAEMEPRWMDRWSPGKMIMDTQTTWAVQETGDSQWPFHLGPSPVRTTDPPLFHLLADRDFTRARLYLGSAAFGGIDASYFYPLDEIFFHYVVSRNGAAILHASGLEIEGKGFLFLGDSGAGKSTIAGLLESSLGTSRVFSDDRIVVRKALSRESSDPSGWWMFGTPWHGTLERTLPNGVGLSAMCFIEQTAEFELESLSSDRALERLIKVYLGSWWMPGWASSQIAFLDELLTSNPPAVYRLGFPNDPLIVKELSSRLINAC
jgi:hypothetical protein